MSNKEWMKSDKDFEGFKSVEEFISFMNYLPLGITISDCQGNVIASNDEGKGYFFNQYFNKELEGSDLKIIRKDYRLLDPSEYPRTKALRENVRIKNIEIGIVMGEEIIWLNITATPLPNGDGIMEAYFNVTENVKREKELEELNNRLDNIIRIRDKFYRFIAHDLKNPFNTLIGFSNLLIENIAEYNKATILKFLKIIYSTSNQTHELLSNLLEWSRSRSGVIEFKPEELNISFLSTKIVKFMKGQAENKKIKLCFETDKNCIVKGDKNMIETVLRNLITNAIKYSYPESEVLISIKNKESDIHVSVKDTGTGMDQESIDKLFQIEKINTIAGTNNERGTGLGLLICKEFIDRHGGKLWVESEPGKGSTFSFSIPGKNGME